MGSLMRARTAPFGGPTGQFGHEAAGGVDGAEAAGGA